jgi:hypothetical protein
VFTGKSVDNHGGDEVERMWLAMSGLATHIYPCAIPVLNWGFTVYQQIKALVTTTTFIYIHPVTRITFPLQKRSEDRDEIYS